MSRVALIGSISSISGKTNSLSVQKTAAPSGKSFGQSLENVRKSGDQVLFPKTDFHKELVKLQQDLASGKKIPPRDLLLYQIKAGQFHLRVELISKSAETVLAAVRKFQNPN